MWRVIDLAGIAVALDAEGADRSAAVDALFGACAVLADDVEAAIEVRFAGAMPPRPDGPPVAEWSDVSLWFTERGAVTRHRSGITAWREGDQVHVSAAPGTAGGAGGLARAFRRTVQHVLVDALADHGREALHAAVVARDGQAVVVLGDTGAGKSTLAVAALRSGWTVLTDDIAWLWPAQGGGAGDGIAVAGFAKPLHVPVELLDELPDGAVRLEGDVRDRVVLPDQLTSAGDVGSLLGIVVVRHGEGAARLVPVEGSELVGLLLRSHPLQASPARVRGFFPLATRLSRRPALVLEHAADAAARVDEAAACLADAWATFSAAPPSDQ